ncbi:MAG: response regulator [Blastomonas sp.]
MTRFVYIVDDEEDVRASQRALLGVNSDMIAQGFADGEAFLDELSERDAGVVLLDINMPGMSGIDLLKELRTRQCDWPVVVITGQGEVTLAVRAMKLGAIDFLEKPYDPAALFAALDIGFAALEKVEQAEIHRQRAMDSVAQLSPREQEIFGQLILGSTNRQISEVLHISVRTVEVHRANLMAKLQAKSLSDVLHVAFAAGLVSPNGTVSGPAATT